jgi:hypothetical protein
MVQRVISAPAFKRAYTTARCPPLLATTSAVRPQLVCRWRRGRPMSDAVLPKVYGIVCDGLAQLL